MSDHTLQAVQDTLKIPLYQEENPRRSYDFSGQFGQFFQNLVPEFAIDPTSESRVSTLSKRQGIAKLGTTDWLTGIVADATKITILDFIAITALYDVFVAAVFDGSNNTIYIIQIRAQAGTATKIGSFTSVPACTKDDYCFLSEANTASGGNALPAITVSYTNSLLTLGKGYYAISASGVFTAASLTEITDTGFPPKQTPALINIGRIIYMNQTYYVATLDGRIFNNYAGQNDVTLWKNANNQIGSIQVGTYPDQCVGIERYKHHIVAFGRNTMEFFNETDTTSSATTLVNTQQAFIKIGAKGPRMIKNINDSLYWFSYGDAGTIGLWHLDGYTPVKLSTPYVETAAKNSWASDWDHPEINIQAALINQKLHIIVSGIRTSHMNTLSTDVPTTTDGVADTYPFSSFYLEPTIAVCYNVADKTWWNYLPGFLNIRSAWFATEFTGLPSAGNYDQIVLHGASNSYGSFAHKNVYKLRTDGAYTDYDPDNAVEVPIITIAQLNPQWFGNQKRKRVNKLSLITDYLGDSDANHYGLHMVYVRDNVQSDTGVSLVGGVYRSIKIPNAQYRHYFNNLGTGRVWSFSFLERSKLNFVYKAIELDIQQGSH